MPLTLAAEALAELDVDMALASVALEFNFTRPQVVEEPVVMVKDGRHPLQVATSLLPATLPLYDKSWLILTSPPPSLFATTGVECRDLRAQ